MGACRLWKERPQFAKLEPAYPIHPGGVRVCALRWKSPADATVRDVVGHRSSESGAFFDHNGIQLEVYWSNIIWGQPRIYIKG